jgi:hypothetical protein
MTPVKVSTIQFAVTRHGTWRAALAFIDNFKLTMLVSFPAIPLVMLVQRLRQPVGSQAPALD